MLRTQAKKEETTEHFKQRTAAYEYLLHGTRPRKVSQSDTRYSNLIDTVSVFVYEKLDDRNY